MGTILSKRDLLRMLAQDQAAGETTAICAAAELAQNLPGPELQALAMFVAQRTDREVHPIFCFHATRMMHPWRLLSLWLYATARGISAPRDLVELTIHDIHARELLRGEFASEDMLRRFYAHNEATIVTCVGELLGTIRERKGVAAKAFKEG